MLHLSAAASRTLPLSHPRHYNLQPILLHACHSLRLVFKEVLGRGSLKMPLTITHRRRFALELVNFTGGARFISLTSHFTPAEFRLFCEHVKSKSRLPPEPIPQKSPFLQLLQPQIHYPEFSTWIEFKNSNHQNCLLRGSVLKVVSWNIDAFSLGLGIRTSLALGHLQELFGIALGHLVVMLQEVCHESLQAILENLWV